jgi:hypothetical protein
MAKPIKDTPVIKGKDAMRFRENLSKNEANKLPSTQVAQMQANYNKLMSIAR